MDEGRRSYFRGGYEEGNLMPGDKGKGKAIAKGQSRKEGKPIKAAKKAKEEAQQAKEEAQKAKGKKGKKGKKATPKDRKGCKPNPECLLSGSPPF